MRRPSRLAMLLIAGVMVLATGGVLAACTSSSSGDGEDSSAEDKYAKRADNDLNDDDTVTMYVSEHGDEKAAGNADKEMGSCNVPDHSSLDDAFEELDDVGDEVDEVKLCDPAYTVDSDSLTMAADDIRISGNTGSGGGNMEKEPRVTIDEHGYEGDGAPFRVSGDDVTLEGIEFSGSPGYGVDASDTDGLKIDQNVFNGNSAGAVQTSGDSNVEITNNTIARRSSSSEIKLRNTDDVVVASNVFQDVGYREMQEKGIVLAGGNDAVDVQGNIFEGPLKSAVYVDRTDDADSANKDVDVHMNSFDEVDHGVAVTSEDAIAEGKVGARDNFWSDESGPGGSLGEADAWVADGEDVDIDTADSLKARFTESYTDPAAPQQEAPPQVSAGPGGTLTMVLFDDSPREKISRAVGQYVGMAAAGDADDYDSANVDFDLISKTTPQEKVSGDDPIRWYDTSGEDPSWRKVDSSSENDMTGEVSIDSDSTPSIDELDGSVFVARDKD